MFENGGAIFPPPFFFLFLSHLLSPMKKSYLILWLLASLLPTVMVAQNAPITNAGTASTVNPTTTLPVTAKNFTNISSFNLELHYDSAIARATSVTMGPLPAGSLNCNTSVPGKIKLGWYVFPGLTVAGNPVLFTITFTRVATGSTAITWSDDGFSCAWYDGNFSVLNDLPATSFYEAGTLTFLSPSAPVITIPHLAECPGATTDVPVTVDGFNEVGKFNLRLQYDPSALSWQSITNNAGFPGLAADGSTPGTVVVTGSSPAGSQGITLPGGTLLFTLHFAYSGGTTGLAWETTQGACSFAGPPPGYAVLNDVPKQDHYVNGVVEPLQVPGKAGAIQGPAGGHVYRGQTGASLSIPPVPGATGYMWDLPAGITLAEGENTNSIKASIGSTFHAGTVSVKGVSLCGNGGWSPGYQLIDTISLGIDLPGDVTGMNNAGLNLKASPNPFSENTGLTWFVPAKGDVSLEITNMTGEKIATIVHEIEEPGQHSCRLSGSGLKKGIYVARVSLRTDSKLLFGTIKLACTE